jgi:acyl-coenzyme A synthetase/AMP-(fatty) acid ligase
MGKMTTDSASNFAGRLLGRIGPRSCFIDAATGQTIRSQELLALIEKYAAALASTGLEKGDRVLIGCTLSPASSLVYLAAMYAGFVAVPIDERTLLASTADLVAITGAKALWTEAEFQMADAEQCSVLRLKGDFGRKVSRPVPPAACDSADLAALMATSGSTGVPRFVKVSHGNLIANTEAIVRSQDLAEDERAILILPVSYCFGASVLHTHLYQGGGVVFDRRFMFPDKVLRATQEFGCTTFAGVPTVYNVVLRRSNIRKISLASLRRFLQAGGALARERVSEMRELFPQVKFYVMYGQTEATSRISCMDPDRWDEKPGSVGQPLDNVTISIVNEDGNELGPGLIGQLMVKGPSICSAYFNDEDETSRVFSGGWLHTGDMAFQDEDGFLWIEGRSGKFLKIRGTRVSIAEVEARVTGLPGVYECGVCAVKHPEAGEAIALFIVPDRGVTLVPEEIRRELPAHWTLDSIRFVPDLPKTPSGKIAHTMLSSFFHEASCNN